MALVVLVSIAACSEEKTIASIEMTETNTIEADNTGSNTSKPKALDNGSHSDPVANTDDETHFSLLSLSNVDVADALTIFVAERQEIAETNNDSSLSTEGKGLFKIEQNGDVTEVNFLNEQGEPFDDTVAPSKMVQGNGYIVMGFIISGENEDGQPTTPTFETVIVRQSDGAAYYIGDDRTLYPGTYQYGLNGARGPINPIATTQSNDVFYSGIDGRLIQITGLGDSSGENIERQFVGPESFTSDVPKVNYNDNLVVMDGAVFLPNLDGSYRISDADLSGMLIQKQTCLVCSGILIQRQTFLAYRAIVQT